MSRGSCAYFGGGPKLECYGTACQLAAKKDIRKALTVQHACLEGIFPSSCLLLKQKKNHNDNVLCVLQKESERKCGINVKRIQCPCALYRASRITTQRVTSHNKLISKIFTLLNNKLHCFRRTTLNFVTVFCCFHFVFVAVSL